MFKLIYILLKINFWIVTLFYITNVRIIYHVILELGCFDADSPKISASISSLRLTYCVYMIHP